MVDFTEIWFWTEQNWSHKLHKQLSKMQNKNFPWRNLLCVSTGCHIIFSSREGAQVWIRFGVALELLWFQYGFNLVLVWIWTGSQKHAWLVGVWFWRAFGFSLDSDWIQFGFGFGFVLAGDWIDARPFSSTVIPIPIQVQNCDLELFNGI